MELYEENEFLKEEQNLKVRTQKNFFFNYMLLGIVAKYKLHIHMFKQERQFSKGLT